MVLLPTQWRYVQGSNATSPAPSSRSIGFSGNWAQNVPVRTAFVTPWTSYASRFFPLLRGLHRFYLARARLDVSRELAERCLRAAETAGLEQMRRGHAAFQATGAALMEPYWLALLAEASARSGRAEDGLAIVASAFATLERSGELDYIRAGGPTYDPIYLAFLRLPGDSSPGPAASSCRAACGTARPPSNTGG